ncbi:glycine betaine ABC transporter substrate-binding protein [Fictibacillus sp. NRS-1165]|uniref:ABC transporter substrate-binding protein n=1 Tax=Fictibacillus sp. NRS-1165 TaxID=3144463 RepID=UPI003D1E5E24
MKKLLSIIFTTILVTTLAACGADSTNGSGGSKGKITVGGKDFTEQHIISKMTSLYLKEKGYDVEEASGMGSTVVRKALENGQVDLYWEYTGTALVVYLKQDVVTDPEKAYETVKEIDRKKGLIWLNKSDVNNTYAVLMRKDLANELGITSLEDLANYVNKDSSKLKFASNAEFFSRNDGLIGLQKKYGFKFPKKNIVKMDNGLVLNALKEKQVQVSMGTVTDGRNKGFNLVVLKDNKQFFPPYNLAPVINQKVLEKNPELKGLLNKMGEKLNEATMTELNYRVDVKHEDVNKVAREWLTKNGFIK